jgi:ADP-ribose pyrophosphatase YjhB (NUDIX family)
MSASGKPANFTQRVPDGDTLVRDVCKDCGFVHYDNPKVVAGAVVRSGDKILLCRRAIEPRSGLWTLPAGYMELNETVEQAALREAYEEAYARIRIDTLLAVYSIPRISQIQVIYRADLADPDVRPGIESLEVELFSWERIPWDEIAFPSVHWALNHFREVADVEIFAPYSNPDGETGDFSSATHGV